MITKHLRNIFQDGELVEESNVQNLHIAGSDKPVKFYNLDAIISVGYRVNSKRGTQFRRWATGVLRDHLMQGWTPDRARFEHNAAELEAALALVKQAAQSPDLIAETGRGLVEIVSRYTQTFLLLQRRRDVTPGFIAAELIVWFNEHKVIRPGLHHPPRTGA